MKVMNVDLNKILSESVPGLTTAPKPPYSLRVENAIPMVTQPPQALIQPQIIAQVIMINCKNICRAVELRARAQENHMLAS